MNVQQLMALLNARASPEQVDPALDGVIATPAEQREELLRRLMEGTAAPLDLSALANGLDPTMQAMITLLQQRSATVPSDTVDEDDPSSIRALLDGLQPIRVPEAADADEVACSGWQDSARPQPTPTGSANERMRGTLRCDHSWLEAVNDRTAAALGACPQCWGHDGDCPVCAGQGAPGWAEPEPALFKDLVVPAARVARRAGTEARTDDASTETLRDSAPVGDQPRATRSTKPC